MDWLQSRLFFIAFLAAMNAGLFLTAAKFGIISWYELRRARWMPYCEFCLFFWMAFIEVYIFITSDIIFTTAGAIGTITASLAAATLSRKLL